MDRVSSLFFGLTVWMGRVSSPVIRIMVKVMRFCLTAPTFCRKGRRAHPSVEGVDPLKSALSGTS